MQFEDESVEDDEHTLLLAPDTLLPGICERKSINVFSYLRVQYFHTHLIHRKNIFKITL